MNWYLMGVIIFSILLNLFFLRYGFYKLIYRMEIKGRVFEQGEEIELTSIIENRKPLTVTFLYVGEKFPRYFNPRSNNYPLFIMPFQRVKRTYKLKVSRRGLYRMYDVHLTLGDFIGFGSRNKEIPNDNELIILPQRADLTEAIVPLGSYTGDISVKRWIIHDPLMTVGIREYTGNEPERYIHWPSTLRYGQLMVKNFDFTTDNSVVVVLNIETQKPCGLPVEAEMIERVISIARTVMEDFDEQGIPYGFAVNIYEESLENRGYFFPQGLGSHHLRSFLEILGAIDYRVPSFFERTLENVQKRQGRFTTGVVITPRILPTYVEPINQLSRGLSRTVVISLEDELLSELNPNILKYRGREDV
jgi:uncharacterized protein (DUF58 family)